MRRKSLECMKLGLHQLLVVQINNPALQNSGYLYDCNTFTAK